MRRHRASIALLTCAVAVPAIAQPGPTGADATEGGSAAPTSALRVGPDGCGAHAAFVASALGGHPLPLSRCLAAVPPRDGGIPMDQLRRGLERLGFQTEARALVPEAFESLRGTWIVWTPGGMEVRTLSGRRLRSGHYSVLHRTGSGSWLLLDFPHDARRIEPASWLAAVLSERDLTELPGILVIDNPTRADESTRESPDSGAPARTEVTVAEPTAPARVEILIEGFDAPLARTALDFGRRREGEKLEGVVAIVNRTGATMELIDLAASCGCTAGFLESALIGQGERAELSVSMDLSGRVGAVRQSVTLVAEGQAGRVPIFVECVAESERQWSVTPRAVAFGAWAEGAEPAPLDVRIRASDPATAPILTEARTSKPWFEATLDATQASRGVYTVRVRLDPSHLRRGFLAGQVLLSSRGEALPHVAIPVTVRVD